jgi:hypothetical protein
MRLSARAEIIFETKRAIKFRREPEPISTFEINSGKAATDFGSKLALIWTVSEAIGTEPIMTIAWRGWMH